MQELKNTYKILYNTLVISGLIVIYLALYQPRGNLGIGLFSIISICCCIALICSIKALITLPGKIPAIPFALGFLLIMSGTLFDVINTLFHSPDLNLEANPIVRLFLDMNYSIQQIYFIGFISQLIFLVMFSVLWAVFLKAYPIILINVPKGSFWKTIVHTLAGPNATIFDFLIGRIDPFFGITAATPIILSVYLYRWYLGLEWLELVPISRIIVPGTICFGATLIYAGLSYKTIRKR